MSCTIFRTCTEANCARIHACVCLQGDINAGVDICTSCSLPNASSVMALCLRVVFWGAAGSLAPAPSPSCEHADLGTVPPLFARPPLPPFCHRSAVAHGTVRYSPPAPAAIAVVLWLRLQDCLKDFVASHACGHIMCAQG